MSDTEPFVRARSAALRLLSYRPRSEAEVRARLRRRFPSDVVEEVMQGLKDQAMVDDAAFARAWTDSRDSLKPRSAWAVKRELTARGVDSSVAAEAVGTIDDEDSAYRAGLSHSRKLTGQDLDTFRRRLWGFLRRRGFSDSISRHAISRLWDEMSDGRGELTADHTQAVE